MAGRSGRWTDEVTRCVYSGFGNQQAQNYTPEGFRHSDHEFYGHCLYLRVRDDLSLYALFAGHEDKRTVDFVSQTLPADLTFMNISGDDPPAVTRRKIREAFDATEKEYLKSLGPLSSERARIRASLPPNADSEEWLRLPANCEIIKRLRDLERDLRGACTVVLCLVLRERLYVAYVGNCRALLARRDAGSRSLRVQKLTSEHTLDNQRELERLAQLGLDVNNLAQSGKLGGCLFTRAFGHAILKGTLLSYPNLLSIACALRLVAEYKDNDQLRAAHSSPLIADPDIVGPIELPFAVDADPADYNPDKMPCGFLLLMSDGVYRALEEVLPPSIPVNPEIAANAAREFDTQTTFMGVAQSVVDRIARLHHDNFIANYVSVSSPNESLGSIPLTRASLDDLSILVRDFSYPMPNAIGRTMRPHSQSSAATLIGLPPVSPAAAAVTPVAPATQHAAISESEEGPIVMRNKQQSSNPNGAAAAAPPAQPMTPAALIASEFIGCKWTWDDDAEDDDSEGTYEDSPVESFRDGDMTGTGTTSTTQSATESFRPGLPESRRSFVPLEVDESGRVAPYVDLTPLTIALAAEPPEVLARYNVKLLVKELQEQQAGASRAPTSPPAAGPAAGISGRVCTPITERSEPPSSAGGSTISSLSSSIVLRPDTHVECDL